MNNEKALWARHTIGGFFILVGIGIVFGVCSLAGSVDTAADDVDTTVAEVDETVNNVNERWDTLKTNANETVDPAFDDLVLVNEQGEPQEGILIEDIPQLLEDIALGLENAESGIRDAREILPDLEEFLMVDVSDYIEQFDERLNELENDYLVDAIRESKRLSEEGEIEAEDLLVLTEDSIDDVEEELQKEDISFTRDTLTPNDLRDLADEADTRQDDADLTNERIDTDVLRDLADTMEEEGTTVTLISLNEAFSESRDYVQRFREDYPEFFAEVNTLIDDIDLEHSDQIIADVREARDEVVRQRDTLVEEIQVTYRSTGTSSDDLSNVSVNVRDQEQTVADLVPHVQNARTYKDDTFTEVDNTLADVNEINGTVQDAEIGDSVRSVIGWIRWLGAMFGLVLVGIGASFNVFAYQEQNKMRSEESA